jgi:hypothetical protein
MADDVGQDMPQDRTRRTMRSRRELMAGAAGVFSALTAHGIVTAVPARAAQGSPVLEGQDNTGATARTGVFTSGDAEFGILSPTRTPVARLARLTAPA